MKPLTLLFIAALPVAGCASAPTVRPASPLALRQIQTRSYEAESAVVLKAVLATFQDEGFSIRTAEASLGFVSATRETLQRAGAGLKAARWTAAAFTYGLALLVPSPKDRITQLDATAQVEDLGADGVRLRVSFQRRVLDSSGRIREVLEVTDEAAYQDFLAKVDKSVFLQREKL